MRHNMICWIKSPRGSINYFYYSIFSFKQSYCATLVCIKIVCGHNVTPNLVDSFVAQNHIFLFFLIWAPLIVISSEEFFSDWMVELLLVSFLCQTFLSQKVLTHVLINECAKYGRKLWNRKRLLSCLEWYFYCYWWI